MSVTFTASTYTFLWQDRIEGALAAIAKAGYAGAEFMASPPHVQPDADASQLADTIHKACERADTRINSVVPAGLDVNLASPDAAMRDWSIRHYLTVGRLAASLGATYLVVHPGRRHPFRPAPYDDARDWIVEGTAEIAEAMRGEGVRPVFENTPSNILDTAEECLEVVRAVGSDRLGICYDVANGFMVEDPAEGLLTVAESLELVHLSDTTAAKWLHDPIGTGEVDFAGIATTIQQLGYDGPIVAETIHDHDAGSGLHHDREELLRAGWSERRPEEQT